MDLITGIEDIVAGAVGAIVGSVLFYKAHVHMTYVSELRAQAEAEGLVRSAARPDYMWTTAKTAMMMRPVGLTFVTFLAVVGVIGFLSHAIGLVALVGMLMALGGYAKWFTTHIEYRVSDLPNERPAAVEAESAPASTAVEPEQPSVDATPVPGAA
ncbi:hypothetical protein [Blastochloris viridis]|uniref:Uncharacterized protein n=1 Tax=Blastochloris viridis TaxID=1079 RepID=A0A0H5BB54_BLAVI|nr:hypothetical protein [Blastochloris viridis]ALK08392.1 hypothetical protein BVIR_595 [Blastochloris viridis]BAR98334.1 hypothetical protein BV133_741 [Blastochloris viridis]CUU41054.1 hypothetical protein BVIRIDIS_00390 [Blastochloris viridis]